MTKCNLKALILLAIIGQCIVKLYILLAYILCKRITLTHKNGRRTVSQRKKGYNK